MICRLAKTMVSYFESNNIIDMYDKEIYEYGAEIFLSTLFCFTGIMVISIFAGKIFLGVMFLLTYCSLRLHVGGYHADIQRNCIGISVFTFAIIILFNQIIADYIRIDVLIALAGISNIIVYALAPVEALNNKIPEAQKTPMRWRGIVTLEIWLAIIGINYTANKELVTIIMLAVVCIDIVLLSGRIKNRRRCRQNEMEQI